MMTCKQQIKILKHAVKVNKKYPIVFDENLWKGKETSANCFIYALNLVEGKFDRNCFSIYSGMYTNEKIEIRSVERMLNIYENLLRRIGVEYIECKKRSKILDGYYKVAMVITTSDTHWLRQDSNGIWSHKLGWYSKPTNVNERGKFITRPNMVLKYVQGKVLEIKYFLIKH